MVLYVRPVMVTIASKLCNCYVCILLNCRSVLTCQQFKLTEYYKSNLFNESFLKYNNYSNSSCHLFSNYHVPGIVQVAVHLLFLMIMPTTL